MIKKYKVTGYWWDRERIFDNLDEVKEFVYDPDRYIEECSDSIYEMIDENNGSFSYGDHCWSTTEVLRALDEDLLAEIVAEEARYQCEESLPYDYDDDLESLELNETLDIPVTHCTVTVIEMIPETEEEAEELGLSMRDMESEAAALL